MVNIFEKECANETTGFIIDVYISCSVGDFRYTIFYETNAFTHIE